MIQSYSNNATSHHLTSHSIRAALPHNIAIVSQYDLYVTDYCDITSPYVYSDGMVAILTCTFKAKFHYASWFEAGRRPASNQIA